MSQVELSEHGVAGQQPGLELERAFKARSVAAKSFSAAYARAAVIQRSALFGDSSSARRRHRTCRREMADRGLEREHAAEGIEGIGRELERPRERLPAAAAIAAGELQRTPFGRAAARHSGFAVRSGSRTFLPR